MTKFKDRWKRHSVAVPSLKRMVDCNVRNADGKVVRTQYEEIVYAHNVYREVLSNGKVGKVLWYRGARVGCL